jgi:tellurite methyltransferase
VEITEHYNELYTKNPNVFGKDTSIELTLALGFVSWGIPLIRRPSALDIGCGCGRNTAGLARRGFRVRAVDISDVAIKHVRELRYKNRRWRIDAAVEDISSDEFCIHRTYRVIVCEYVLHQLSRDTALSLVRKMQEKTEVGGINVIAAFTKDSEFYKLDPSADERLYLNPNQLASLYQGWNLVWNTEVQGKSVDGRINVCAHIAALKT